VGRLNEDHPYEDSRRHGDVEWVVLDLETEALDGEPAQT
jgi:hypothetical protein